MGNHKMLSFCTSLIWRWGTTYHKHSVLLFFHSLLALTCARLDFLVHIWYTYCLCIWGKMNFTFSFGGRFLVYIWYTYFKVLCVIICWAGVVILGIRQAYSCFLKFLRLYMIIWNLQIRMMMGKWHVQYLALCTW